MDRKWPLPEPSTFDSVRDLIDKYHPYKSMGSTGHVWVCRDSNSQVVAAWIFQPPPYGSAKAVSPGEPQGATSLSRMVAVPKSERNWHISKPLRWILKNGIDRGRYPVVVTYADVGEGHCGNVYKCAGMSRDGSRMSQKWIDASGSRRSVYSNGGTRKEGIQLAGRSEIIRFVHRVCDLGSEREHMESFGWKRVPMNKVWKSGNRRHRWVKEW